MYLSSINLCNFFSDITLVCDITFKNDGNGIKYIAFSVNIRGATMRPCILNAESWVATSRVKVIQVAPHEGKYLTGKDEFHWNSTVPVDSTAPYRYGYRWRHSIENLSNELNSLKISNKKLKTLISNLNKEKRYFSIGIWGLKCLLDFASLF